MKSALYSLYDTIPEYLKRLNSMGRIHYPYSKYFQCRKAFLSQAMFFHLYSNRSTAEIRRAQMTSYFFALSMCAYDACCLKSKVQGRYQNI